ncbi:hypothetical protein Tco_0128924 [Tanacetum coccineum]
MHNNIMAAGSKDRPPMLGPGRYSQWRSRFLWYIDTKPNGEGLRKSILSGPYVPSTILVQVVAATEEAIFLLLTGIGDDIYSTVDACKTANEMWIAIERLQQGESLNVQDVKTNLFWEFGKFTSRDGESMESYYSRHKGQRESPNQLQPQSESVSVEDSVLKQAQRDKDMAKEFGPPLLAKVFQKALQTYHTHNLEPYAKLHSYSESLYWL